MPDLFDYVPPPKPTGLEIGHARAEDAADHAGDAWKEIAFAAFVEYAKDHRRFVTEDVRSANPDVGSPPDLRAWGHVALRAKREGIVQSAGVTRAKSLTVHGMHVTLWESLL